MLKGASRAVLKIVEREMHEAWRQGYDEGRKRTRSIRRVRDRDGSFRPGGPEDGHGGRHVHRRRSARGDHPPRRRLHGFRFIPYGRPCTPKRKRKALKPRSGSPRPRGRVAPGPLRIDNGP